MADSDAKFLLQGTLKIVPTPQYLKTMGYIPDMSCPLCEARCCSFKHIASCCSFALEQQRFTWRHDELLKLLHYVIGNSCVHKLGKPKKAPKQKACFILQGQELPKQKSTPVVSLLEQAVDWHITVDLPAIVYKFPFHITITEKRPDLVLWSEALRTIVLLELTVPHESNVRTAHTRKNTKYTELRQACRDARYRVELMPVEIGPWLRRELNQTRAEDPRSVVEGPPWSDLATGDAMHLCHLCPAQNKIVDGLENVFPVTILPKGN